MLTIDLLTFSQRSSVLSSVSYSLPQVCLISARPRIREVEIAVVAGQTQPACHSSLSTCGMPDEGTKGPGFIAGPFGSQRLRRDEAYAATRPAVPGEFTIMVAESQHARAALAH